jgi:hypothetical protein
VDDEQDGDEEDSSQADEDDEEKENVKGGRNRTNSRKSVSKLITKSGKEDVVKKGIHGSMGKAGLGKLTKTLPKDVKGTIKKHQSNSRSKKSISGRANLKPRDVEYDDNQEEGDVEESLLDEDDDDNDDISDKDYVVSSRSTRRSRSGRK